MHNFKFKAIQNSQDRTSSYTYIFPQLTNTLSSAHSNPYKWYNPVTYSLQARIKEIGEHSRSSDYTHTHKKIPKQNKKRETAAQLFGELKHFKVPDKNLNSRPVTN